MSQNISINPFVNTLTDWKEVLKDKHILFDNDAIVSMLAYDAEEVLQVFKEQNATCCYIDPIYIELSNTNNAATRIKRQDLLHSHGFEVLPMRLIDTNNVHDIQAWLAVHDIYPSPTDLYLVGMLDYFERNNIVLLLTSNLRDFPYPLFTRESYIMLQSNKNTKALSLLKYNKSVL